MDGFPWLVLLTQLLACWVSQPWLGWCLWVPGTASRAPSRQQHQNWDGSLDLLSGKVQDHRAIPTGSNCPELPGAARGGRMAAAGRGDALGDTGHTKDSSISWNATKIFP